MRIVVAMSGGVDSSVAAALLAEQGHDVIGVSMQLYDHSGGATDGGRAYGTCCTIDDLHDARRVAAAIGIPHYILNFESQFDEHVVSNFVREYVAGPHADPLRALQQRPEVRGAARPRRRARRRARWPPGHYARIDRDDDGRFHLLRGAGSRQGPVVLPVLADPGAAGAGASSRSGISTRPTVREHARRLGLRVAEKPDSQEICFVPDGDYAAFVEREAPELTRAGAIVAADGRVLGTHEGVHRFTIGQRKGLRPVLVRAALRRRRSTPPRRGSPSGRRTRSTARHSTAAEVNWTSRRARPRTGRPRAAQIRHRHAAAPGARARARRRGAPSSSSTRRRPPSRRGRPWCSTTATKWSAAAGSSEASSRLRASSAQQLRELEA